MDVTMKAAWTGKRCRSSGDGCQCLKAARCPVKGLHPWPEGCKRPVRRWRPHCRISWRHRRYPSTLIHSPHFCWARERVMWRFKDQIILEEILRIALTESDVADPDLITPNLLLMGLWDGSLVWCMAQANYSSAGDGGTVKSLMTTSGATLHTDTFQASNWDRSGVTWQPILLWRRWSRWWTLEPCGLLAGSPRCSPERMVASGLEKYS